MTAALETRSVTPHRLEHASAEAAPDHVHTAEHPVSLKSSMVLHLASAAGLLGLTVLHAVTTDEYNPSLGPLIHGIGIIGMATLLAAAMIILGLRATGGSHRDRFGATGLLALSPALLLIHTALLIAVLPALTALVLLWVPASNTFIKTAHQRGENSVSELLDSRAVSNRVPYSNLGQNFNQPPGF